MNISINKIQIALQKGKFAAAEKLKLNPGSASKTAVAKLAGIKADKFERKVTATCKKPLSPAGKAALLSAEADLIRMGYTPLKAHCIALTNFYLK